MHPFLSRRDFLGSHRDRARRHRARAVARTRPRAGGGVADFGRDINPANPNAPRLPHFAPRAKTRADDFLLGRGQPGGHFDFKTGNSSSATARRCRAPKGSSRFRAPQGNLNKEPVGIPPVWPDGQDGLRSRPASRRARGRDVLHPFAHGKNEHARARRELHGDGLHARRLSRAWAHGRPYALGTARTGHAAGAYVRDPRSARRAAVCGKLSGAPGFLPAAFQGTDFNATQPLRNLSRPSAFSPDDRHARRAISSAR